MAGTCYFVIPSSICRVLIVRMPDRRSYSDVTSRVCDSLTVFNDYIDTGVVLHRSKCGFRKEKEGRVLTHEWCVGLGGLLPHFSHTIILRMLWRHEMNMDHRICVYFAIGSTWLYADDCCWLLEALSGILGLRDDYESARLVSSLVMLAWWTLGGWGVSEPHKCLFWIA